MISKISYLGMIVVSLFIITLSIVVLCAPKKELNSTNGTIVDIREAEEQIGDEEEYDAYVSYSADGKDYENVKYPEYSSDMEIGDKVEVLYDKDNPTYIESPGSKYVPIIVLVGGIIGALVGVFCLLFK